MTRMYETADEKRICEIAVQVQDACNIAGVLHSYWDIVCRIRELHGWEYQLYSHPAVILFHDKLEDMLGVPVAERTHDYYSAYSRCKDIAGGMA